MRRCGNETHMTLITVRRVCVLKDEMPASGDLRIRLHQLAPPERLVPGLPLPTPCESQVLYSRHLGAVVLGRD